jgi:AraC-like DNA-binding protein
MEKDVLDWFANRSDLRVYHCGMEKCLPCHTYGPSQRDHFLIHFVRSGRGVFRNGDHTFSLTAGQAFLICPGRLAFYQADRDDPWDYVWIGFSGTRAESLLLQAGLSAQEAVFGEPDGESTPDAAAPAAGLIVPRMTLRTCFEAIAASIPMKAGRETHQLGLLYLLLASRIERGEGIRSAGDPADRQERYVRQATDFLGMNYSHRVSVADLSRHLGLDRSYMGALFRAHTGLPPQQYLLRLRMEKAAALVVESDLAISTIARSVGYEDPLLFSRMFRKVKGQSPVGFRRVTRGEAPLPVPDATEGTK